MVADDQELVRTGFCVILEATDWIAVVAEAANGAPAITRRLIEDFCRGPAPGAATAGATGRLSERELEVVRLVAQGLSNAEIAARLYLSEATVKSTLPASWPSWAYATACRSRSSPTRKASCGPAAAPADAAPRGARRADPARRAVPAQQYAIGAVAATGRP